MPSKLLIASLSLITALFTSPGSSAAQLPFPVFIEARGGIAFPMFEDDLSVEAEPGPTFAVGGRVHPIPVLGVFAGYHQSRFGCVDCSDWELDETIVVQGAEGGVHLNLPRQLILDPWVRGGLTYQTLRFSSGSDRMSSSQELGFTVSGGVAFEVVPRLQVSPGIRYLSAPAGFNFSFGPELSTNAAGLAIEVGVAVAL